MSNIGKEAESSSLINLLRWNRGSSCHAYCSEKMGSPDAYDQRDSTARSA